MNEAQVIERSAGEVVDLGVLSMRMLVGSERTGGSFASAEFRGGAGPWTVPHVHKTSDEAFYSSKATSYSRVASVGWPRRPGRSCGSLRVQRT